MRSSPFLFCSLFFLTLTLGAGDAALAQRSAAAPAGAGDASVALTVEALFGHGALGAEPSASMAWTPDGKALTYLDRGELVSVDRATGKAAVLLSRSKVLSIAGGTGDQDAMARYAWAPDGKRLLFDANGALWLYDQKSGTGVHVGSSDAGQADDTKFSPNGQYVSFVRRQGLSVARWNDLNVPQAYAVATPPLGSAVSLGEVDWVYGEELGVRSNYFWSPDSSRLAMLQMNEGDVSQYPIADWLSTHATVDNQRYPQAGDTNPDVRLGVVGTAGGHVNWVRLPIEAGQDYVPRFGWVDKRVLWFETLTRDHQHRRVYFADPSAGQVRQVLEIGDDKFLNDDYEVVVQNGVLVTLSWKDGHTHLYLYRYNAANPMAATAGDAVQLTKGDFDVSAIGRVDAASKVVQYASNEGNALEQQLWQVDFDGVRKALTTEAGFHVGNFSPDGKDFVDLFSTRMTPPVLRLCAVGGACHEFWKAPGVEKFGFHAPEVLETKAADGTTLYSTLMLPAGATQAASVPLIVNPYGGPGPQTVVNRWGENFWGDDMPFDALLAAHGFAVLRTDNRGMGARGRDFAQAAYHHFGDVQLADQLAVLDSVLAKYAVLDRSRLGWWGWSWGGHFTLYAMTHSDRFKAGVAVAPVTDWRDYDSIYTERYLGMPVRDAAAYRDFSSVTSAGSLKGKLLLMHGTGDDNVHFENSVQFIERLIGAGLPYEFQIYPRKRHDIAGADVRVQLFERLVTHFEEHLKGSPRP